MIGKGQMSPNGLNAKGIAAAVLKYRLPEESSNVKPELSPLMDVQRAIRLVRYNAELWNIDKEQVGVMGFSAGGHLASTLGTHYEDKLVNTVDLINLISARPDFMLLIYPVVTMKLPYVHKGSRVKLLGEVPELELIEEFSNELQVTSKTPPTFLIHSQDDKSVPVENSILFYQALRQKGVEVEMHLFPHGGHGYSLAQQDPALRKWPILMDNWLKNLRKED